MLRIHTNGDLIRRARFLVKLEAFGSLEWWEKQADGNRISGANLQHMRIVFQKNQSPVMLFGVKLVLFTSALQDIFSLTFDKVNHFHVVLIVQVRSMVGMTQCIVYGHVEAIGGGQIVRVTQRRSGGETAGFGESI